MGKKYKLVFSSHFYQELSEIILYINTELKNPIAANRLLDIIEKKIYDTLENPLIYTANITRAGNIYYRVNVNNYCIFYTVDKDTMVVRRIIYAKEILNS